MAQSYLSDDNLVREDEESWPAADIDQLDCCPVCGSLNTRLLYDRLTDTFMRCAPGMWAMHRCGNCETAFINPRPSSSSIHRAYTRYYTHDSLKAGHDDGGTTKDSLRRIVKNSYLKYLFGRGEESVPSFWLIGFLLTCLGKNVGHKAEVWVRNLPKAAPQSRLLDIGCGDGSFLKIAESAGYESLGIDPDSEAVARANRLGLTVLVSSAYEIPLVDNYFDRVTLNHVIEHVHFPLKALKSAYRLLKPGGILWLATPNINCSEHSAQQRRWFHLDPPRHLMLYSQKGITNILQVTGFSAIIFHNQADEYQLIVTCIK